MFTSNSATCQICKLNIGQSILKSFRTLRILTVRMLRHTSFSKRTHLLHSEHQPSGIGHTGNPLGIGHTGNRSDQEHGSVRTRHHSDVSCSSGRDSNTRPNTIPLHHAEPGEHSLASMISRPARNLSRSYDSVSPRCHSRLTSRSSGKKKSHKKRKHFSTSSSSSCRSSSSSSSEVKEKEKSTNLKRRRRNTLNHIQPSVIRVRRSTRGRGVLLHLLPCCLLLFLHILLLLGEVQPGRSLV